jgi:hypothetical protein
MLEQRPVVRNLYSFAHSLRITLVGTLEILPHDLKYIEGDHMSKPDLPPDQFTVKRRNDFDEGATHLY